jgi:PLP dependent protein
VTAGLAERVARVRERVAEAARRAGRNQTEVTLIAVSKTHPPELVREAHRAGLTAFGENYVQELRAKQTALADIADLAWHFVGGLQRNKAKEVVGRVALLHALDGVPLAEALSRRAPAGVVQDVLVEVNVGGEASKAGVAPADLPALLGALPAFPGVRCRGLMAIPPPALRPEDNRPHFRALAALARAHGLAELSMGMSDDFEVAIEEGATLVRVGTAIFGPRAPKRGLGGG